MTAAVLPPRTEAPGGELAVCGEAVCGEEVIGTLFFGENSVRSAYYHFLLFLP
jgi:hypothetical protein